MEGGCTEVTIKLISPRLGSVGHVDWLAGNNVLEIQSEHEGAACSKNYTPVRVLAPFNSEKSGIRTSVG